MHLTQDREPRQGDPQEAVMQYIDRRNMRRVLVAAVLVTGMLPAGAQAQPIETIVQDDALMLHGSDDDVRLGMKRARELGIDRVRLTAGWSVIAPHPDIPEPP